MRLALLADIHGNLAALEAVVEDLQRRQVDKVVNLGDHASGPLLPAETVRFLMTQDWVMLAGNHERQLLTIPPESQGASDRYAHGQLTADQLAWLSTQTSSMAYGDDLWLCHGTPASDSEYFLESVDAAGARVATADEIRQRLGQVTASVVACAHSHIPRCVRSDAGQLVVNPGSVGLPAYDDDQPCPHVMASGSPDARYAVLERRDGAWSCQLIAIPYDHEDMARLAQQRGRDDWAMALRTGYL